MSYTPSIMDVVRAPDVLVLDSGKAVMRNAVDLTMRQRATLTSILQCADEDGISPENVMVALGIICDMDVSTFTKTPDVIEMVALLRFAESERPGNAYYGQSERGGTPLTEAKFDEMMALLTATYGFPPVNWLDMPRWEIEWYLTNVDAVQVRRKQALYESQIPLHANQEVAQRVFNKWEKIVSTPITTEQQTIANQWNATLDKLFSNG